jgi:hypothetical protein
MTKPLTRSTWTKVLSNIKISAPDDTTRTLAQMLLDMLDSRNSDDVSDIFDTYGARLLEQR